MQLVNFGTTVITVCTTCSKITNSEFYL